VVVRWGRCDSDFGATTTSQHNCREGRKFR
jgi:hypothetical protein